MSIINNASTAKKVVNFLFDLVGLEIRRRNRIERSLSGGPHQLTANHIVEFLGPSGIGKSTIFNKSKAMLKHQWNLGYDSELYKLGSCEREIAAIYRELYWSSLHKVKSKGVSPINETETIVSIIKRFQADLSMRCVTYNRGFFLAEGVFAYCSASAMELDEVKLKKIIAGRSFILVLPAKTETAVERFVEREGRTGVKRNYFRHLSHGELFEVQKRAIKKQLEFGQSVESLGCKVLWLRAEDDVEKNVKKVIAFENNVVEES